MMIALATLSLVLGQQTKISYDVPIGASVSLHERVLEVKKHLAAKDFKKAALLAKRLPTGTITYSISKKNLRNDNIDDMMNAVDNAASAWGRILKDQLDITEAKPGTPATIKFSFEPVLAKRAGENIPAGSAVFESTIPTPTVEGVLGLKRGAKLQASTALDIFNEAMFTFGTYFGLAAEASQGTAMGRLDQPMTARSAIIPIYIESVKGMLALSKNLREAAAKGIVVEPTQAKLMIDAKEIQFPTTLQGDYGDAKALVSNIGNGTLLARAAGDCTCIAGTIQPSVGANHSTMLLGKYNTIELAGHVQHNIVLRTNDPDRPLLIIPAKIEVKPRVEVVYPFTNTYYVDPENPTFTMFVHSFDTPPEFEDVQVIGVEGTATVVPFIGQVPDFLKGTEKREINGYRVDVDLSKVMASSIFGRMMGAALIRVNHPVVRTIKANFYVQRGIVAQPEQVYLGKPTGPTKASFVIAAAGKPFKITKVSSNSPHLTFSVTPRKIKGEFTVTIDYDGKSTGHVIEAQITVETDDPKQAKLTIPIATR